MTVLRFRPRASSRNVQWVAGHEPLQACRRPDGRLVGRARSLAALRQGLRRRRRAARLSRHPHRCRTRYRDRAADNSSRMPRSTCCMAARARTALCRACSRCSAFPIRIPACWRRRSPCRRISPRSCCRRRGVPVPEGMVVLALRGGEGAPAGAALCDQADRGRLERRRLHRHRRARASAAGAVTATTGRSATACCASATSRARS